MIRLLCVLDVEGNRNDMVAEQLATLVKGLPKREFDVHVCTLGDVPSANSLPGETSLRDELESMSIPVTVIPRRFAMPWFGYCRLAATIRRLRPDVIHGWGLSSNVATLIGGSDTTVVNTLSEVFEPTVCESMIAQLTCCVPRLGVDCVVANTPSLAEQVNAIGVHVISPIANRPDSSETTQFRAERGLPADKKLLGLYTDMEVADRAKDALWAMDLIQSVRDDIDLIVCGDGAGRARLERYARQVTVADRTHFIGNRPEDRAGFFASLDLLWEPSLRQRVSVGIMEAMIRGIPVVAADTEVNRDLLGDGRGTLVMPGHRAGYARQAKRLLTNPDEAAHQADTALNYAAEHFATPKFVEQYIDVYRECTVTPAANCSK